MEVETGSDTTEETGFDMDAAVDRVSAQLGLGLPAPDVQEDEPEPAAQVATTTAPVTTAAPAPVTPTIDLTPPPRARMTRAPPHTSWSSTPRTRQRK